jgi:hypothetical protein
MFSPWTSEAVMRGWRHRREIPSTVNNRIPSVSTAVGSTTSRRFSGWFYTGLGRPGFPSSQNVEMKSVTQLGPNRLGRTVEALSIGG